MDFIADGALDFESKLKSNFSPAFNQHWEKQYCKDERGNSTPDSRFRNNRSPVNHADTSRISLECKDCSATSASYSGYQSSGKNAYHRNCRSNSQFSFGECSHPENSPRLVGTKSSLNSECSMSSACIPEIPYQLHGEGSQCYEWYKNEGNNERMKFLQRLHKDSRSANVFEKPISTKPDSCDDRKFDDDINNYQRANSSCNHENHAREDCGDHLGYTFNDSKMALVTGRLPNENTPTPLDKTTGNAKVKNFRELSLYPTHEDIIHHQLTIPCPKMTNGTYDSVEEYLYMQLCILREHVIINQLRIGLCEYLESKPNPDQELRLKYGNLRLYPGTRFQVQVTSKTHQRGIVLNFDPLQKMRKFVWEWSNRFAVGSLLVFTTDYFHTFFFGTVLESNLSLLQCGEVLVSLTEEAKMDENLFDMTFLMAETEVFIEPYCLIMKQLKDLNDRTFPMKQYIIDGRSQSEYPSYLYSLPDIKIGSQTCDPFDTASWPSADSLELDPLQYVAFKAALTRKFCVIEGSIGTGKTQLWVYVFNKSMIFNVFDPKIWNAYTRVQAEC